MREIDQRQWASRQGTPTRDRQARPGTARTIEPGPAATIAGLGNVPHPGGGAAGETAAASLDRRYAGRVAPIRARRLAHRPSPFHRARVVVLLVLGVALSAGCGSSTAVASFDPASPCTTDGRFPGAYPDLEAMLPTSYADKPPDTRDSGRSCTDAALGTLAAAGIDGVRFAGATWSLGGTTGLTVAVFEGDGLDAPAMLAFYQDGAAKARRTEKLKVSDTTVGGTEARRLDVLGSDGTGQTIVAWPADAPGRVNVLLASDLGDAR